MSRITNLNEDEEDNPDMPSFKIILLGDSTVGKTSLIVRFCDGGFNEECVSTIGVDTKTKYVRHNNKKIELEIWDTAGQERFKSLATKFYQGADGIILMYDITQKKTFNNIKYWLTNIMDSVDSKKVAIIVIGNKLDLPNIEVEKEAGEKFCSQHNLQLIETSCKDNINVKEAFNYLIDKMIELDNDYKQQLKKRKTIVNKNTFDNKKKNKKKCSN